MVQYANVRLHPIESLDAAGYDLVAVVDTQPGTGNNSLPAGVVPEIVIDHHPVRQLTRSSVFTDIRGRYGATSTILCEYLAEAGIVPDTALATALVYGIRSDTQDLGRESTKSDINAFLSLYPLANTRVLGRIEHGPVPVTYFRMLAKALRNASVFGPSVVTGLEDLDNPDMLGEVADLLLRKDDTAWTLCYGWHDGRMIFSLRTSDPDAHAGRVAHRIAGRNGSGGGHRTLAAGRVQIAANSPSARRRAEERLVKRFVRAVGADDCIPEKLI
jgi:nanoRNase/pAp phosphatase (c-di-AMP/oligoRNAs hydrolase)